ncbi:386_t:CDS:2 [Entrophospora sp. SA101]|nr:386_t:CDS:2 [Entrophospora sp. SA101]CAJ0926915.1 20815_t:CDS:2 [Entrophospora sp. SA101]
MINRLKLSTLNVVKAYEEVNKAYKKATLAVEELKAILPPDTTNNGKINNNILRSDTFPKSTSQKDSTKNNNNDDNKNEMNDGLEFTENQFETRATTASNRADSDNNSSSNDNTINIISTNFRVGDVKGKNSVGSVSGDGEEEDTVRETAVGEVGGRENLLKRKSKNLDNKKHNKKVVIGKVVKDNEMVVIGVDVSRDGVIVEDTHVVDNYVNKRKSTTPLTAPITTTDTTTDITTNAITDTTTNTTANITTINITQTISKSIPSITFPSTSLSPPESESSSPSSLPSISIEEQKIILREFNHYYRLRMSDKSTTQWKIANEIRDISDVKIALAQSTVSKILSKNSMPKDTNTLNAIKKWVENEKNKTNNVIDKKLKKILNS